MPLKKAQIIVDRGSSSETIEVLFNPNEYAVQSGNQYVWQPSPGMSMPVGQFISGQNSTLTMELFFDTYEKGTDVRNHTKKIAELLDVDKDLHAPPICHFVWGSLNFKGVVEKVSQKYTMFLDSGVPVRARCSVTFKEWHSKKEQLQNIPRQSADRTKQRTLKQGDQLWAVADAEYGDPGKWREIAAANEIDNPRELAPGRQLVVPRLE